MKIWQELRRRQVFGTVALYAVAAWAVIEVTDMAIESGVITGLTTRGLFILALIGFPLALLAGWFYDVTKKGVFRTPPIGADESFDDRLQIKDYLFLLALLATWSGSYVYVYTPPLVEKSIAVMPFDWCQDNPSDTALAGGIHAAVIDKLALQDQLKVISRSAIYNLADVGISPDRVVNTYNVQYLLSGELCRDGADVLMRAEVTDNSHVIVWNGNFRQSVNRLDQVEQQLATVTAQGIAVKLGEVTDFRYAEPIKMAPAGPINALALEKLRIGQHYRQQGDKEKAREALEEALEREPEYAEALFELALVTQDLVEDSIVGGIRNALPIAERALAVARTEIGRGTTDYKAHWVTANILLELSQWERALTWRTVSTLTEEQIEANKAAARSLLEEAEQHLRAAIRLNPSEPELRRNLWFLVDAQGIQRMADAQEILEQARIAEPFDEYIAIKLAYSLANRGQYHRAMEELERFEVLGEVSWRIPHRQMEIQQEVYAFDDRLELLFEMLQHDTEKLTNPYIFAHLYWSVSGLVWLGLEEEAEALYQSLAAFPIPEESENWAWARQFFLEDGYRTWTGRGDEAARELLAQLEGMSNEEILDQWYLEAEGAGLAFWQIGEADRAIQLYEALSHIDIASMSYSAKAHLIMMYITIGRDADAAPLLDELIADSEEELAAGGRHPTALEALTSMYACNGQDEEALRTLKMAVDYGAWFAGTDIVDRSRGFELNTCKALQGDPRFERQMRRAQALRDQKADNVRRLLATHDIDALLTPVIEMLEAEFATQQKNP